MDISNKGTNSNISGAWADPEKLSVADGGTRGEVKIAMRCSACGRQVKSCDHREKVETLERAFARLRA